jgi:carbonic anhydrase
MHNHPKFPVAALAGLASALLAVMPVAAAESFHRVEAGNTLFSIARSHGITVEALRQVNGLQGNAIQVGQRLRLPSVNLAEHHEGEDHEHDGHEGDDHHSALDTARAVAEHHEGEDHEHDGHEGDDHHSALDTARAVAEHHEGEDHEHDGHEGDDHHSALDTGRAVAEHHEGEDHEHEGHEGDDHHSALEADPPVAWGYGPDNGPRNWARLAAGFSLCGAGKQQAPIDLVASDALAVGLARPVFGWTESLGRVQADAQGVRFLPSADMTLELDGRVYALREVRMRSPSEHTLGGAHLAGELQFIHEAEDGSQAHVAVLLERASAAEQGLALPPLPTKSGKVVTLAEPFNLVAALPSDPRAFRYEGSMTVPPCSEGVKWVVLQDPLSIGPDALSTLRRLAAAAVRPVQPGNGRALLVDSGNR